MNRSNSRRFWQGEPAPDDAKIMGAAHEVEIKLMRGDEGQLAGFFKISGSFGADLFDEFSSGDDDPAAALRFAKGLMSEFQRQNKDRPPPALT